MKPIQTEYKGYLFRSRLEARWAYFFDKMQLKWDYEAEGFELDDGQYYLPDFKVYSPHGWHYWYEVKPQNIRSDEKFNQLKVQYKKLLVGDPYYFFFESKAVSHYNGELYNRTICPRCGAMNISYEEDYFYYHSEVSLECWPCDLDTPGGGGQPVEQGIIPKVNLYPHKGLLILHYNTINYFFDTIKAAAKSARMKRFGEG
jgi:hypothetical protein